MLDINSHKWFARTICIVFTGGIIVSAFAQSVSTPELQAITFPEINGVQITLDGHLDEAVWQQLDGVDNPRVIDPDTLQPAAHATVSRFFYNERGLYVGIEARQPVESLISRLSSRDAEVNRDGKIHDQKSWPS